MGSELATLLESSGAILRGHFLLASGRHSDVYFEKFRVLERPDVLSRLCSEIVDRFAGASIDVVAGPTTGGIIIAFEVARQLGVPALYVEREDGKRVLRRGAKIDPGARVLIVDDVLTRGTSVLEVRNLLIEHSAEVVGVGVLIDRSDVPLALDCPLYAAHRVEAQTYPADELPEWLAKIPIIKPGTSVSDNKQHTA